MAFRKYNGKNRRMPRPATGRTPVRNLRVPDAIWKPALEKAKAEGTSLTDVIIKFLIRYISSPPKEHKED
jgi:hypothetical protein